MTDNLDTGLDVVLSEMEGDTGGAPAPSAYETKSNWEATQRAFDAFKAANDRRLDQIRATGAADPVTADEVSRLEAELDRLAHGPETKAVGAPHNKALPNRGDPVRSHVRNGDAVKQAVVQIGQEVLRQGRVIDGMAASRRASPAASAAQKAHREALSRAQVKADRPPGLAARLPGYGPPRAARNSGPAALYKQAIIHWMKTGREEFRGVSVKDLFLAAYGAKGLHSELNPAGGYLIRPERRGSAGWVGEREARPPTADPEFGLTSVPVMEMYSEPEAGQRWLDGVDSDVESWLTAWVAEDFALQEGPAFITGDSIKKPMGLLNAGGFVTDHSQWAHGSFRLVVTGVDGAFPAAAAAGDKLIDVQVSLKTGHQPGASWLMTRLTAGAVRKLKDSEGRYLWQPGLQPGQPPSLLNSPLIEEPNMPEIGADTTAIGYGDWSKTYIVVEKGGVRMLRDPYSNKPHVRFYTTKMVGGTVQNFDAAVFLKFAV